MPELIRLYIRSVAIGFVLSGLFTAGLLWRDVAGLGHLVAGSDMGWVAVAMLVVFNGIVFSGVQFGVRIMLMTEDAAPPPGRPIQAQPVVVPARES